MSIGIDLGSRRAKFALLRNGKPARLEAADTIPFYKQYGRIEGEDLFLDLEGSGVFSRDEILSSPMAVTGYGRNTIGLHGARVVSEVRAHVAGAVFQTGLKKFTLLDMGGQDTKVAAVRDGRLTDFVMNDKCAASSGRFLENMAAILDVSLEELASHWKDPAPLDATCGIFGESELIGQILRGVPLPRLCAGVNHTLVKRLLPMLVRFRSEVLIVTGGVAFNRAVVRLLVDQTQGEVLVPDHPQHNGAIGCAVLASLQ